MHTYYINGLEVQSEIPLPCSIHDVNPRNISAKPVVLRYGGIEPDTVNSADFVMQRSWMRSYDTGDGVLMCNLHGFRLHIGFNGDSLALFFNPKSQHVKGIAITSALNMGLAACLLLRGKIPLHAASAEIDGNLFGFLAPSGTGKTTTLWRLLDQGGRLCSDDLTTVEVNKNEVLATPTMTQHAKLDLEAMERRGMNPYEFQETYSGSDEFWIPIDPQKRLLAPYPLNALFILNPSPYLATTDQIKVSRISGASALPLLWENMHGLSAVFNKISQRHFAEHCLQIAKRVPLYRVEYYKAYTTLPRLVETMRNLASGSNNSGSIN
jgi:hypothetical protein